MEKSISSLLYKNSNVKVVCKNLLSKTAWVQTYDADKAEVEISVRQLASGHYTAIISSAANRIVFSRISFIIKK